MTPMESALYAADETAISRASPSALSEPIGSVARTNGGCSALPIAYLMGPGLCRDRFGGDELRGVGLDDVALFEVGELRDLNAALEVFRDLADVVFEAT